jgi:hypothetical protein
MLQVADDSPIRDVDMRNNWEHFDERADEFLANASQESLAGFTIASPLSSINVARRFRVYDPTTTEVVFWGDVYNIRSVIAEAERIKRRADEVFLQPPDQS